MSSNVVIFVTCDHVSQGVFLITTETEKSHTYTERESNLFQTFYVYMLVHEKIGFLPPKISWSHSCLEKNLYLDPLLDETSEPRKITLYLLAHRNFFSQQGWIRSTVFWKCWRMGVTGRVGGEVSCKGGGRGGGGSEHKKIMLKKREKGLIGYMAMSLHREAIFKHYKGFSSTFCMIFTCIMYNCFVKTRLNYRLFISGQPSWPSTEEHRQN